MSYQLCGNSNQTDFINPLRSTTAKERPRKITWVSVIIQRQAEDLSYTLKTYAKQMKIHRRERMHPYPSIF